MDAQTKSKEGCKINVYEQQARALKDIAAELKGIRRALESIDKSLKPDVEIVVDREEEVVYMCSKFGGKCDRCMPGFCTDPCKYRVKEGAGNG